MAEVTATGRNEEDELGGVTFYKHVSVDTTGSGLHLDLRFRATWRMDGRVIGISGKDP